MPTGSKSSKSAPSREEGSDRNVGLEGASEEGGVLHREGVEGGEGLSIGGAPPSAAGGHRHPTAPTRDDATDED